MMVINVKKIRLQITKLWAGHEFAVRSCCDLDLQGSSLNVAIDTSSQNGDHSCEKVFKSTSNKLWAVNNFAEGHVVTLIFNVASQMLRATHRVNMVINYF